MLPAPGAAVKDAAGREGAGGGGERGISPLAVCSLPSLDFVRPPGCQMEGGGRGFLSLGMIPGDACIGTSDAPKPQGN